MVGPDPQPVGGASHRIEADPVKGAISMTRNRRKRWLWSTLVAAASLTLVMGASPSQAEEPTAPGDIQARVTQGEVDLHGWPAGSQLDVVVGAATFNVTVAPDSNAVVEGAPLATGTHITVDVTEGAGLGLHNEMTVGPLELTWVDYANDVMHGVALQTVDDPWHPGTMVQACTGWQVGGDDGSSCRWVPTDQTVTDPSQYGLATSTWTADFSQPGEHPWGGPQQPTVDLRPYWMGIEVSQQATPLGPVETRTAVSPLRYPHLPYLDVQYRADWDPPASGDAVALGFDEGTTVQFSLLRGGDLMCYQEATVEPPGQDDWDRRDTRATFDVWSDDGCNPALDDVLVADGTYLGQPLAKELTVVAPRDSGGEVGIDVDVAADIVSGTVPAGFDVDVGSWDGPNVQVLVPDGVTTFSADFSAMYDVQPWSWFGVQVLDPEGDVVDTQLRATELVLTVTPSTGLVGGQVVQLTGENFKPGTATAMQGHGFIGGLDEGTAMQFTVGPDGTFSVPYQVQQFLNVPTGPEHEEYLNVDCGAVDESQGFCFLVVMNDQDWAQVDSQFKPAVVTLTVQPTASLVKASGRVTISGTTTCSPLAEGVQVEGRLTQRIGRKTIATGTFSVAAPCNGPWTISVLPDGRVPFGSGTGEVVASGTLMAGDWTVIGHTTRLVSIKVVKR